MAGAFTAVADDGSAVYYNPAGISQIDGTSVEASVALISPQLRYTTPGDATETSTKSAFAPSFFITHRLTDRLSTGLGLYAPYARDAEFGDDLINGFASQRSKMVRTDFSAVISYKASDAFSIGGGLVIGYSQVDRSIPAGPALRINDKMDGMGFGGIVGLLWKVSDRLKAGVTYRTGMSIDHDGERIMAAGGVRNKKQRTGASTLSGIARFRHSAHPVGKPDPCPGCGLVRVELDGSGDDKDG